MEAKFMRDSLGGALGDSLWHSLWDSLNGKIK